MKLLAYILWGCQLVAATSPEDLQFQQQQGHPSSGLIQNPVVSCDNEKRKLLCLPPEYSKFDLPFRNDFNFIDIGIEISDVLKVNDKDYSITFSLYFNVQWSEPRLNLSQEYLRSENITGEDQLLPVNLELIYDLWVPNIFIYNLKTFKVIYVLSKLAGLWINSKKEIYYSQATHITFICPMLFDSFPLDTQVCKFQVGSYSYDMTKMLFKVTRLTFIQKQSIVLDYKIAIRNLRPEDQIFNAGALGNYSLAGFEMNLQRHVMSYIITYYLPSGLFVVVSWISFLIPPDIVPGRMALLITLFLVLINIFNNITTNSPKAEGLTAIEIWMLACILFVFGSLIEYAVILFKKQKKNGGNSSIQSGFSRQAMQHMSFRQATVTPTCQSNTYDTYNASNGCGGGGGGSPSCHACYQEDPFTENFGSPRLPPSRYPQGQGCANRQCRARNYDQFYNHQKSDCPVCNCGYDFVATSPRNVQDVPLSSDQQNQRQQPACNNVQHHAKTFSQQTTQTTPTIERSRSLKGADVCGAMRNSDTADDKTRKQTNAKYSSKFYNNYQIPTYKEQYLRACKKSSDSRGVSLKEDPSKLQNRYSQNAADLVHKPDSTALENSEEHGREQQLTVNLPPDSLTSSKDPSDSPAKKKLQMQSRHTSMSTVIPASTTCPVTTPCPTATSVCPTLTAVEQFKTLPTCSNQLYHANTFAVGPLQLCCNGGSNALGATYHHINWQGGADPSQYQHQAHRKAGTPVNFFYKDDDSHTFLPKLPQNNGCQHVLFHSECGQVKNSGGGMAPPSGAQIRKCVGRRTLHPSSKSGGGGAGGHANTTNQRSQSILDKHYSTWSDKYSYVDRFFLLATPFLFLLFNIIYWMYFYIWDMMSNQIDYDASEENVEYVTLDETF